MRSRDVPLLVTLDDMQWADAVTTWAVRLLSQRLASSPIGWVLAARAQAAPPRVAALMSTLVANGAPRLELQPLDANDMARVAADVLGATADPGLTDFLGGVGGNPFLGLDLLQALVADDAISIDDGVASLVERRVPDRFRASVRGRLATLSHNALHFVQAGSVFGRSFRVADIAAMLASWPSALVPAVDEAVRANVLVEVGTNLEFCHDLIRQAISHDMSESTRVALHRGAAAAILARSGLGDRSRDAPARVGGTRRRSGDRGTARRRGRDLRPGSSHRGRAHAACTRPDGARSTRIHRVPRRRGAHDCVGVPFRGGDLAGRPGARTRPRHQDRGGSATRPRRRADAGRPAPRRHRAMP